MAAEQQTTEVPRRNLDQKGDIIDLLWQLKKENYSDDTLRSYGSTLYQLKAIGVDLFNPESFKDAMANHNEWTNCRKYNLTKAYRCFLNHHKIEAKLPKYRVTRPLPYVPPEKYLDQLIASCTGQMSVFLQTLKETGARPGEALRLEWNDIDIANRKITISHPEKGCNPRTLPISENLLNLLLTQPRTTKLIFNYKSKHYAGKSFRRMRHAATQKLGSPELLQNRLLHFSLLPCNPRIPTLQRLRLSHGPPRTQILAVRATVCAVKQSLRARRRRLHLSEKPPTKQKPKHLSKTALNSSWTKVEPASSENLNNIQCSLFTARLKSNPTKKCRNITPVGLHLLKVHEMRL